MDSLTLVHWFTDSVNHWFIGSLVHWLLALSHCCVASLIHWFIDRLIHWLIGWSIDWFIGSFTQLRTDSSCHFVGISTTICSFVGAPHNFETSLPLHRKKKKPVESMGRWFPIAMFLVRTARAVPGITGIKSLEVMSHTDLPISNFQSRRNQSKYQMCIVVWYCRDFPGTLACGTRVAYDSFLIFWHQVCYSGHVNQHTDTKTYLTSHW